MAMVVNKQVFSKYNQLFVYMFYKVCKDTESKSNS